MNTTFEKQSWAYFDSKSLTPPTEVLISSFHDEPVISWNSCCILQCFMWSIGWYIVWYRKHITTISYLLRRKHSSCNLPLGFRIRMFRVLINEGLQHLGKRSYSLVARSSPSRATCAKEFRVTYHLTQY